MVETGQFATLWKKMADALGLQARFIAGDWRSGVDAAQVDRALAADRRARDQGGVRGAQRDLHRRHLEHRRRCARRSTRAHPALLMVDTISGLASIDYRHDEWGVDVTVAGSQKGLMLPPGLGFNAVSDKALAAQKTRSFRAAYWGWDEIIEANQNGYWPTRRRPICSMACRRRSISCLPRACPTCSRATAATATRPARRCAPGAWRSCAATRPSTRTR
jgi:alanine-glyoxylate transaminase / serine-glyoxylate transaminase / serine-pyruvate transaminase